MKEKEKMIHLPERISAYVQEVTAGEKILQRYGFGKKRINVKRIRGNFV